MQAMRALPQDASLQSQMAGVNPFAAAAAAAASNQAASLQYYAGQQYQPASLAASLPENAQSAANYAAWGYAGASSNTASFPMQNMSSNTDFGAMQQQQQPFMPNPLQPQNPYISQQASFDTSLVDPNTLALARFADIAQRNNVSLDHLAQTLSTQQHLTETAGLNETARRQLALDLVCSETTALYRRCMLMAGYTVQQTAEDSRDYLDFCREAWQMLGYQIQAMQNQSASRSNAPGG
jgi:hypothetical protein